MGHELDAYVDGNYATETGNTTNPVSVLRMQVRYRATRAGMSDDIYENVMHFVNTAGELPGAPATDVQKGAVNSAFTTFFNSQLSKIPSYIKLDEIRWYHFSFDDPITGPPTKVSTGINVSGSAGVGSPSQIASTITFRTAERRHWGRIYFPFQPSPGSTALWTSAHVDSLANSFRTFVMACDATDLQLVIYSKIKQACYSIYNLEVDDVPDVVRRRRPKLGIYKKILTS